MTFPNIYDDALYEQLYWFGFILAKNERLATLDITAVIDYLKHKIC